MLHPSTLEAVKAFSDLVLVISDYVSLKKKGANFVGLCPFHSEKTGSFFVSPGKKLWHCFGCHESGDLISFVMKVDNLDFPEAVRVIAGRAGIEVRETEKKEVRSGVELSRGQIKEILVVAREFFANNLPPESAGLKYLSERGLTSETISDFGVGMCPSDESLWRHLLDKGFSQENVFGSGLFFKAENGGIVSRFQNRLIFPVVDHIGRTVGFGGRVLPDDKRPAKYINSPETIFFDKKKILFALDKAKSAIKEKKAVILMEGYMDVAMAHQYGFANSVAPMGTALTPQQAQLLKRFTSTVFLALDSDEAGQIAVERSFEVLRTLDIKVLVLDLEQKDPADCLVEKGAAFFQGLIESPTNFIEFKFNRLLKVHQTHDIETKALIVSQMVPFLRAEKDGIVRSHYVGLISRKLNIDKELVLAKMEKSRYNVRNKKFEPVKVKKDKFQKAEELLIYLLATSLDLRKKVFEVISEGDFIADDLKPIVRGIKNSSQINKDLLDEFSGGDVRKVLSRILFQGEELGYSNSRVQVDWMDCVETLKRFRQDQKIGEIKAQLKENTQTESQNQDLLKQLGQLIQSKETRRLNETSRNTN